MHNFIDLTGNRYGRLTVIRRGENTRFGQAKWVCKCDCGNAKTVEGRMLRDGKTTSCGCYHKEVVSKLFTKHKAKGTQLYTAWRNLKSRTSNPNSPDYKWYGGRGITVCDEWKNDYIAFEKWAVENGFSSGLTIDRIDPDGNYEPSNCRWIPQEKQQRNRRSNAILTMNGESHCIAEWAEIIGCSKQSLYQRRHRHPDWPHERILAV